MRCKPLPKKFFQKNRIRLANKLPEGSCAIIYANETHSHNADGEILFKQNSDFFYLTGIEKPSCTLLILGGSKDKKDPCSILFIPKPKDKDYLWEGNILDQSTAAELSGINKVLFYEEFWETLYCLSRNIDSFCINANEHSRRFISGGENTAQKKISKIKQEFPLHKFDRLAPIMANLRTVKSDEEIEKIISACEITEKAFRQVLRSVKNCKWEYELEGEIMREVLRNGSSRLAYNPIIGSGKNALVLHYTENHRTYKDGELILLDFGAEYCNYASDTTRVIPTSGKFSQEQAKIYDAVLQTLQASPQFFKIGKTVTEAFGDIIEVLKEKMLMLGIIKSTSSEDHKKFFMHGMGHHLGLDVHDFVDETLTIQDGMVFAIEPAIYIAEKNIGIRLENNFYVKDGKLKNTCESMPISREEVENLINFEK